MTGLETTALTALTNGLIGQIAKSGWEGISSSDFIRLLNQDVSQIIRDSKYLLFREYAQKYWNRHGQIKVLKMSKPMNLESIYINVKCLNRFTRDSFVDAESLEKSYRQAQKRRFWHQEDEKQDGLVFANNEKYLMVFGEPGIGKSTFLRKIGLEALKGSQGDYQHYLTPVLLELKNFKEEEINIQKLIEQEFEACNFPNVSQNITKKLQKGELLILLDGLDEVPTANINNVIDTIKNFVDQHDQNRFIISCRTAARTNFTRFTDIEIAEFDDDQIKNFIENWFSSILDKENETAKNCWELLQKEEYKSAKELAHTPLLLTFLCLVYDENQSFPTNRSRLYQDALRILLEKWSAEKRLPNRGLVYENLNIEQEEILLSEIAYFNFIEDKLFLEKREVVKQIKGHLKQNLNAPQYLDGEKVLKTIEIEQGILVQRASEVYSFSHLTLQEYLTAQYIYDNDLIEEIVKNHVTETRWREVFLLIAGLMRGKADKLLLAMEREAHGYLNTTLGQKLVPILQWSDEITKDILNSPVNPLGRRAISYANAYANAYIYANEVNYSTFSIYAYTYADSIANDYLDKTANTSDAQNTIFGDNGKLNKKDYQELFQKLLQEWNKAFTLNHELLDIDIVEIEEIDKYYFYINRLMLDCQKSAVKVSAVWEEIEDRMLRVP